MSNMAGIQTLSLGTSDQSRPWFSHMQNPPALAGALERVNAPVILATL